MQDEKWDLMRFILAIFLTMTSLYALEMEENYKEALVKAKAQNKPLLAYLYMLNCHTCQYMDREVFSDVKVQSYLKKNYVVVHLYTNANSLPPELRVEMSPVFHFIDSQNGEMIESIVGGRNATRFLKLLKRSYHDYLQEQK